MGARIAKMRQVARTPTAAIQSVEQALESKIISPRHPSTVKGYEELTQANPEFERSAKEKNEVLHKMLNSVHVDSTGAAPTDVLRTTTKRFSRRGLNVIPEGKLSSEKLSELFINRKISPEDWTEQNIADHYKLDLNVAQNLTKYFGSFYIYKTEKEGLVVGNQKKFYQTDDQPKELS